MSNPYQSGTPFTPNRGRPSKKLPKPFSRPRIEIGGSSTEKKDWQWVNAFDLEEGDIIAGEGVVLEIKTHVQYGAEWRMYLRTPRYEHGTIVEATKKYYTFSRVKN
jgi:hypothetical protein